MNVLFAPHLQMNDVIDWLHKMLTHFCKLSTLIIISN